MISDFAPYHAAEVALATLAAVILVVLSVVSWKSRARGL
jgi:hypothetical protein